jgi:hypothetical protein
MGLRAVLSAKAFEGNLVIVEHFKLPVSCPSPNQSPSSMSVRMRADTPHHTPPGRV